MTLEIKVYLIRLKEQALLLVHFVLFIVLESRCSRIPTLKE
jgi:hypothetical protein